MKWLDSLPWSLLIIAAVVFLLLPVYPQPHVVEKIRMLADGSLSRPLDVFDMFYHCLPLMLILIKLMRQRRKK